MGVVHVCGLPGDFKVRNCSTNQDMFCLGLNQSGFRPRQNVGPPPDSVIPKYIQASLNFCDKAQLWLSHCTCRSEPFV